MPIKCSVDSCKLQADDPDLSSISFHKLPVRETLREEWLKILKKHCRSIHGKYLVVCSQHFERECFQYGGLCKRRMLKNGSVPTIFSDFEIVQCEKQSNSYPCPESQLKNSNRSTQCDSLPNKHIDSSPKQNQNLEILTAKETDCQVQSQSTSIDLTDPISGDILEPKPNLSGKNNLKNVGNFEINEIEKLRIENAKLRRRNQNLNKRLGRCRKRIRRFEFLFETLRQQKYISDDQSASLQVGFGMSILK